MTARSELEDHPLLTLLARPNTQEDGARAVRALVCLSAMRRQCLSRSVERRRRGARAVCAAARSRARWCRVRAAGPRPTTIPSTTRRRRIAPRPATLASCRCCTRRCFIRWTILRLLADRSGGTRHRRAQCRRRLDEGAARQRRAALGRAGLQGPRRRAEPHRRSVRAAEARTRRRLSGRGQCRPADGARRRARLEVR